MGTLSPLNTPTLSNSNKQHIWGGYPFLRENTVTVFRSPVTGHQAPVVNEYDKLASAIGGSDPLAPSLHKLPVIDFFKFPGFRQHSQRLQYTPS